MSADGPHFTVIGDCLLDVAVRAAESVGPGEDAAAEVVSGPGGQGANVAVRLARRGRHVSLVAPVAVDDAGRLLRDALAADGVKLVPLRTMRTGSVVVLVDASGERTMYSDRPAIDAGAAAAAVGDATWIHVSGYALLGEGGLRLAEQLAGERRGRPLSVNGGSATDASRAAGLLQSLSLLRPALLVLGAAEARALAPDRASATDAATTLATRLETIVVVTDGAHGARVASEHGATLAAPARPVAAVDATGAGDAFAAALVDRLAGAVAIDGRAAWPPDPAAMRAALASAIALAARVVAAVGAQARVAGEGGTVRR